MWMHDFHLYQSISTLWCHHVCSCIYLLFVLILLNNFKPTEGVSVSSLTYLVLGNVILTNCYLYDCLIAATVTLQSLVFWSRESLTLSAITQISLSAKMLAAKSGSVCVFPQRQAAIEEVVMWSKLLQTTRREGGTAELITLTHCHAKFQKAVDFFYKTCCS